MSTLESEVAQLSEVLSDVSATELPILQNNIVSPNKGAGLVLESESAVNLGNPTIPTRVCNFLWAARSRLIDVGGDSVTK